jgi:glycosyltransferase involved in cell wall biosynthesis
MTKPLTATILLPTTADRGPLLPLVVGCMQRQTVPDFELFIIGDGVDEVTRTVCQHLAAQDDRIHFFDHPKHPRRGEEFRHAALQKARGRIVLYCCDRDLWLPQHIAQMDERLQTANFVTGYFYAVLPDGTLDGVLRSRLFDRPVLTAMGHTLALYNALPQGWATTPAQYPTDVYMARKLVGHPVCRPAMSWIPTFLYLKRGDHPGLSTTERYRELYYWTTLLQQPNWLQEAEREAFGKLAQRVNELHFSPLLIRGKPLSALPERFYKLVRHWLRLP